jgi:superfamily II DNA or RNA helicase
VEIELDPTNFDALVASEVSGEIAPADLAVLEADRERWEATLRRFLAETEEWLENVARSNRDERDQAVADLTDERDELLAALRYLTHGDDGSAEPDEPDTARRDADGCSPAALPTEPALQASWMAGQVVLWAGNPSVPPADRPELDRLIDVAGAAAVEWEDHRGVSLPTGERATACAAPLSAALGWLVGVGAGQLAIEAAPSTHWLGEVAVWATELVAQGRMVPAVRRTKPNDSGGRQRAATFVVEWLPAVVDRRRLQELASLIPGPVIALDRSARPERLCRAVLAAGVDAICRAGAARLVTAAIPPVARSRSDVSEAVLASLGGSPFRALPNPGGDVANDLQRWAAPVQGDGDVRLTVALDPPSDDGGWLLSVEASGVVREPLPVDRAVSQQGTKSQRAAAQLARLERLVPALRRSGRRGHVVLSVDEAWEMMTRTGAALVAAGFDVRVPAASLGRRPGPRLRLEADPSIGPARVGANQLSAVRWSVLFDDVELDAQAIARLTAQARPLVRARGRWVELERADLEAAAKALAEQATTTELSGAAILRHAVGLEEHALAGPAIVDGSGWAVDLVRGVTAEPPAPLGSPEGFVGELRSYQAQARGWLAFLDRVGLGGCLAMDMGLGKTPTMLAHLLATQGDGPVLVAAPPAVLGNWAAEAERFTPSLRVYVHHGPNRAEPEDLAGRVNDTDLVLTTYATAVRDAETLATIDWHRVVLDEAQAIKNPASEAARELRRIPARSRLALTGTPIENGLGDLWSILDFTNPGLVGPRTVFIQQLSKTGNGNGSGAAGDAALRALNGLLVFRRTKAEPEIAEELPDKIDELDHCGMTPEQVGLYQAVLDNLIGVGLDPDDRGARTGQVLAAITALKQICDHPAAYLKDDTGPLEGRSGKLGRLDELVDNVFAAGERVLVFTHFAQWGERLAEHLTKRTGIPVACYHGGLTRTVRDRIIREFQEGTGPGALVLSIKAGGSGLNLTAANHVVLYDRWWNPAVEDQARDRAWRIGQASTVISHRLVCPGTVDERVEEVVAGKRRIADLVLPASTSLGDLSPDELRTALGLRPDALIDDTGEGGSDDEETAA